MSATGTAPLQLAQFTMAHSTMQLTREHEDGKCIEVESELLAHGPARQHLHTHCRQAPSEGRSSQVGAKHSRGRAAHRGGGATAGRAARRAAGRASQGHPCRDSCVTRNVQDPRRPPAPSAAHRNGDDKDCYLDAAAQRHPCTARTACTARSARRRGVLRCLQRLLKRCPSHIGRASHPTAYSLVPRRPMQQARASSALLKAIRRWPATQK